MRVRLKDIAKELGLSVSTVNAALLNRSDISLATRQRVQAMVRKLNYQPNLVARSLSTRKTHVIGVVVPDLSRSFFAEVIKGIDEELSPAGYSLLVCNTQASSVREDSQLRTLIAKQVDGLIIASAHQPGSSTLKTFLGPYGIPFVLVDRRFPNAHFVGGDDIRIGKLATTHLLDEGYRRIAHLRGPNVSTALGRLKGYQQALKSKGLRIQPEYIVESQYHEELGGYRGMKKLLDLSPRPDAVFAASDPIAIGALRALMEMKVKVPREMGVIGVGNDKYGDFLRVPLSTVREDQVSMGKRAARLLLDILSKPKRGAPRTILLQPELIVRKSSKRNNTH